MQELVQEAEDEGTQEQRGQASAERNAHATSAPWRPASAGNVMARCSSSAGATLLFLQVTVSSVSNVVGSRCPRKPVH